MAIRFKCGECGRVLNVKDGLAGKKGKCPGCGGVIEVPLRSEEEAPPEPMSAETGSTAPEPTDETPTTGENETACPHCGQSIATDAVFCVHCGTDLRTGEMVEDIPDGVVEEQEAYDFFKTAPDMLTKPTDALDTIINSPPTAATFKKALILFGVGLIIFTLAVPYNNDVFVTKSTGHKTMAFALSLVLGVIVLFTDAILCGVGGSMFGSRPTGFAHVFMGVLAVRAMVGLALVLPLIYVFTPDAMYGVAGWVTRAVRFGWGTFLVYVIILRAYEAPPLQAIFFAVGAGALRAMVFLLPSLFNVNLI